MANKAVAVDVSNQVHKLLYIVSTSDIPPFEEAVRDLVRWFRRANSTPCFVFDGKAPQHKSKTQAERKELKQRMASKAEEASKRHLHVQASQYRRLALVPTGAHYAAFRRVCSAMECPCVTAKGEAEKLCVEMEQRGEVDAVATTDSDVLALGCKVMVSKIQASNCEIVLQREVLAALGLEQSAFRDFCVMCGTDYNSRIPRVGPVTALKMVKEQGSLEKVLDALRPSRCADVEDFERDLPLARFSLTCATGDGRRRDA